LIKANDIDCVVAKENVEEFVENMFGRADLSDRSVGGLIKLAKFAKEYLNSPDYMATQKADMKSSVGCGTEIQARRACRAQSDIWPLNVHSCCYL